MAVQRRLIFPFVALGLCSLLLNSRGDSGTPFTVDDTGTPATVGDKGSPAAVIYITFEVDSSLPNERVVDTMKGVEQVIRKRAEGFGAEVTDVEHLETGQVVLEVSGVALDEADELFARTALVDFREPERDEGGDIVCEDAAGQVFTVPGDTVPDQNGDPRAAYIVTDAHGNPTECQGADDAAPRGTVVWTPAKGVGSDGVEKPLTSRSLEPDSEVIFDALGRPLLRFRFDAEGASLFDQITARLVGFPIAIYLDGEIISAPIVRARIEGDSGVIEGLTENEARMLAIQLNSGPLPQSAQALAVGERSQP